MTRRLSNDQKHVRGTVRDDRKPKRTAMERLRTPPRAPRYLSDAAKAEGSVLARAPTEIGVLTLADLRALELLCEILATESELRVLLKTDGMTIAGAGNNSKSHPACKLLESTRNQAARMLGDFGLTPRGRQGVDVRPGMKVNPFSVYGRDPAAVF